MFYDILINVFEDGLFAAIAAIGLTVKRLASTKRFRQHRSQR